MHKADSNDIEHGANIAIGDWNEKEGANLLNELGTKEYVYPETASSSMIDKPTPYTQACPIPQSGRLKLGQRARLFPGNIENFWCN